MPPRRAAPQQRPRPVASPISVPSPTGGWNVRDALDAMPPEDAVLLDNWFPALGEVTVRPGSASYATGLGGTVETLAEYDGGATRKFLGAANGSIFDVSSPGAVGAALATGFTSNRWQTANFKGKQFWVNGADTEQSYDGSSFAGSGWTGFTSGTAIGIYVFKSRVFILTKSSQGFWYAPVNNITGAVSFFDLSTISDTGGNVILVTTLSYTGGATPDDLIAFVLNTGEVILYQGDDPANAAAWSLAGKYKIGTPVNTRAVTQYGGDSYLTTLNDHTSLNSWFSALRNGVPPQLSKIAPAVAAATLSNASAFGWQAIVFQAGTKIVFNVPNSDGSFSQHVLNTVTGSWCRYTGLNAHCWGLFKDALYFGASGGVVIQAETGNADSGAAINASGQQAWSKLKSSRKKRIPAFRPIIQSEGGISFEAGVGFDFNSPSLGSASATPSTGAPWDTSPWDVTSWGPDTVIDASWRVSGGEGSRISAAVNVAGLQQISWLATDYMVEQGIGLP